MSEKPKSAALTADDLRELADVLDALVVQDGQQVGVVVGGLTTSVAVRYNRVLVLSEWL